MWNVPPIYALGTAFWGKPLAKPPLWHFTAVLALVVNAHTSVDYSRTIRSQTMIFREASAGTPEGKSSTPLSVIAPCHL